MRSSRRLDFFLRYVQRQQWEIDLRDKRVWRPMLRSVRLVVSQGYTTFAYSKANHCSCVVARVPIVAGKHDKL